MLEEQQAEAQQALDELLGEQRLPFTLYARRVWARGIKKIIVYFQDSRLPGVEFSWREDESFKDVFQAAVLDRVKRLDGESYGSERPPDPAGNR